MVIYCSIFTLWVSTKRYQMLMFNEALYIFNLIHQRSINTRDVFVSTSLVLVSVIHRLLCQLVVVMYMNTISMVWTPLQCNRWHRLATLKQNPYCCKPICCCTDMLPSWSSNITTLATYYCPGMAYMSTIFLPDLPIRL